MDDFEWIFEKHIPCSHCRAKAAEFYYELEHLWIQKVTPTRWYPVHTERMAQHWRVDFTIRYESYGKNGLPLAETIDMWSFRETLAFCGCEYRTLRPRSIYIKCKHTPAKGGLDRWRK